MIAIAGGVIGAGAASAGKSASFQGVFSETAVGGSAGYDIQGWAKMSIPLPEDFIIETGATPPYGDLLLPTEEMIEVLVAAQA